MHKLTGNREAVETMVLVGDWGALPAGYPAVRVADTLIVRCEPRVRAIQQAISTHMPTWLILADGLDDDERDSGVQAARLICTDHRVAMLGPVEDLGLCERSLRRLCSVYMALSTSIGRLLGILRVARECNVVIVDKCFQDAAQQLQVQPLGVLTRREREVLHRLRLGRRNLEIADELHVSSSTVEFHVRNVLEKLGARNRVEAIKRANLLGL